MAQGDLAPHEPSPVPQEMQGGARTLFRSLDTILAAVLRCWPILVVPALLVAIAAETEQGRDVISATASLAALTGPGFHAYAAQGVTTMLATLAALILLARWEDGFPTRRYAAHFVPGLIGLLAGYLAPMAFDCAT